MLYVANIFMALPSRSWPGSGAGWPGEVREPPGELPAGLPLADGEPGRDLAHRQQRGGRRGPLVHHLGGERPDLAVLHLGVLELAEAVLQRLQLPDRLPVLARVVQRAEDLDRKST